MLPAAHGDALWIEFGDAARPRRLLVDGGTAPTYESLRDRIGALAPADRRFDLLVVTHVDADHIEGVVRLSHDAALGVSFNDVWFNGWRHLRGHDEDTLGPAQGEMLSGLLEGGGQQWNAAFERGPVAWSHDAPLPSVEIEGLSLTVLSPGPEQLARLRTTWDIEVRRAGLEPGSAKQALEKLDRTKKLHSLTLGPERPAVRALARAKTPVDRAVANGSSIALLAEWEGRAVVLGADAHPDVLARSLEQVITERGLETLRLDAFKLPHHASAANVTTEMLRLVDCDRYLISTNGAVFHHPDSEAIARVIEHGGAAPELWFNYRSPETEIWDDRALVREHGYRPIYADRDSPGVSVELE